MNTIQVCRKRDFTVWGTGKFLGYRWSCGRRFYSLLLLIGERFTYPCIIDNRLAHVTWSAHSFSKTIFMGLLKLGVATWLALAHETWVEVVIVNSKQKHVISLITLFLFPWSQNLPCSRWHLLYQSRS